MTHPSDLAALTDPTPAHREWRSGAEASVTAKRSSLPLRTTCASAGGTTPTAVIAGVSDSAPPVVEARCVQIEPGVQLGISNAWRMPDGREDEWFLNHGMKIEELGNRAVVLHCSDGIGNELTFDYRVRERPGAECRKWIVERHAQSEQRARGGM
jgi:hypothetical protein